jgi:hypothetical protein
MKYELKGRWCRLVIHAFMLRAAGHSVYQSTPWFFAGKNRRLHLDVFKKNAKPDSLWGKESYSAREPARKVKTKDMVRNKSLIRLVVSFPGWMFHSLMSFNCFTVSFQNRWSGSRE